MTDDTQALRAKLAAAESERDAAVNVVYGDLARLRAERDAANVQAMAMREALEFYAYPAATLKRRGELDEWVPDFYEELNFGDRAQEALAAPAAWPKWLTELVRAADAARSHLQGAQDATYGPVETGKDLAQVLIALPASLKDAASPKWDEHGEPNE